MDEATYYTNLFRACRKEWSRNFPARKQCFDNAKVTKDGELVKWTCAACKLPFAYSETQCDHVFPIQNTIPRGHQEFVICSERLHVSVDGLQVLCKRCHQVKTRKDNDLLKKKKLVKSILNFSHEHHWCPDIFINEHDNIKNLNKFQSIINKYNKEHDEKKIVRLEHKMIKLIESR